MYQELRLTPALSVRLGVGVKPIPGSHECQVHMVNVSQIVVEVAEDHHSVAVRESKGEICILNLLGLGHEMHHRFLTTVVSIYPTLVDRVQHRGPWAEVERDEVRKSPPDGRWDHGPNSAALNVVVGQTGNDTTHLGYHPIAVETPGRNDARQVAHVR